MYIDWNVYQKNAVKFSQVFTVVKTDRKLPAYTHGLIEELLEVEVAIEDYNESNSKEDFDNLQIELGDVICYSMLLANYFDIEASRIIDIVEIIAENPVDPIVARRNALKISKFLKRLYRGDYQSIDQRKEYKQIDNLKSDEEFLVLLATQLANVIFYIHVVCMIYGLNIESIKLINNHKCAKFVDKP